MPRYFTVDNRYSIDDTEYVMTTAQYCRELYLQNVSATVRSRLHLRDIDRISQVWAVNKIAQCASHAKIKSSELKRVHRHTHRFVPELCALLGLKTTENDREDEDDIFGDPRNTHNITLYPKTSQRTLLGMYWLILIDRILHSAESQFDFGGEVTIERLLEWSNPRNRDAWDFSQNKSSSIALWRRMHRPTRIYPDGFKVVDSVLMYYTRGPISIARSSGWKNVREELARHGYGVC